MDRLGPGVDILASPSAAAPEPQPFLAEILDGRAGYLRLGSLTPENLAEMDAALQGFSQKKIGAVVLDLRATPPSGDFDLAADLVRRFSAKGKLLFTLKKPGAKQERMFTSNQEPRFQGFVAVLADGDVEGAGEVIAGALRSECGAVVLGGQTAGAPVEFADVPLRNGRLLRVAVGEIVVAGEPSMFPEGLQPDLAVEMHPEEKDEIFKLGREKGVSQFVFETERPRFNEASLVAGTNPELEAYHEEQENGGPTPPPLRDPVLQRAVDLATSVAIFENRKGR
jgi:C-terminal processing protease CtpA/Prc